MFSSLTLRPVLHALWRQKCLEIGIFADECWITSSGTEIIYMLHAADIDAKSHPGPSCPHRFEILCLRSYVPESTRCDSPRCYA